MPTLASDIITRAYRIPNIIPLVATPNTNQVNEALPLLNEQILGVLGFEAGRDIRDLNIGGEFDQSAYCAEWVPHDVRLILNLSGATTLSLHPRPYDGQRLSFVDAGNSLATHNLTLDGNGRTIEGSATLTLNTDGDSRDWIYRADTANWVKISALLSTDAMPFPQEFDGFFAKRLAMELSPSYGQALSQATLASLGTVQSKLRARYRKPRTQDSRVHGLLTQSRGFGGLTQSDFNAGRTL